jgi:hypothetical protein
VTYPSSIARVACAALFAYGLSCSGGGSEPQCSDGLDNDGDTLIDFPDDPSCTDASDTTETPSGNSACDDGLDNDSDGHIDFPSDPGCSSRNEDDEGDGCPGPVGCPQCGNGVDDDSDGAVDYPADTGCTSAGDDSEFSSNPGACGSAVTILPLSEGSTTGELPTGGLSDLNSPICGGAGDEVVYELVIAAPTVLTATTRSTSTVADTVLYLRSNCGSPGSEITCNADDGELPASTITATLSPGGYYLIVDNQNSASGGAFILTVELAPGPGAACTSTVDCGAGLSCRVPDGGGAMACTLPRCNDGLDQDGDGDVDYPADPGCSTALDDDEDDSCPGVGCPACSDGADNDGDGAVDYPADATCYSAGQPIEGCGGEQDPMFELTTPSYAGTTFGAHDDLALSCGGAEDLVGIVTLPAMATITIDTNGTQSIDSDYDTLLAVLPAACTGGGLVCNDDGGTGQDAQVTLNNLAAGTYAVVIATTAIGDPGAFVLNISGTIAANGRCDGELALSGAITCGGGNSCVSGLCVGSIQCNDGVDNDGDGFIGFPADPGCTSADDADESDDCPDGPECPQCGDGVDNDNNGFADYGADTTCASASSAAEGCVSVDPVLRLTTPSTSGDSLDNTNDATLSCGTTAGQEDIYLLRVSSPLASLVIDTRLPAPGPPDPATQQLDTVLGIRSPLCSSADLACNDDAAGLNFASRVTLNNVAIGDYFVIVEDRNTILDRKYSLNVAGVLASGAGCESPEFSAGMFVCGGSETCTGSAGSRTCQ